MNRLKLIFTFLFLFLIAKSYGQINKLNKDTSKYAKALIMRINLGNDSIIIAKTEYLDHNSIDSSKVERKKRFVAVYGPRADKGVNTIYLTPGTKILNTQQLLTRFNISTDDMNLPVFIDSAIDTHPAETYFQLSVIRSVKIETERKTHRKYISILSIYPIIRKKMFDTYINGTYTIPETD